MTIPAADSAVTPGILIVDDAVANLELLSVIGPGLRTVAETRPAQGGLSENDLP